MNVSNLFDFSTSENISINARYITHQPLHGNSNMVLAVNCDNKIMSFSNEWTSLIRCYYDQGQWLCWYSLIVDFYNKMINECNPIFINKKVIPLITSFSKGTVHGYAGLFSILKQYLDNIHENNDYHLLVYSKSQSGILEIINHFANKGIIDREKLITIDENQVYQFDELKIIPNQIHNYSPNEITESIMDFIGKHMIEQSIQNELNSLFSNERVAIIKSHNSVQITGGNMPSYDDVVHFCNSTNSIHLEPGNINEVDLINRIYHSQYLITTWGTAFFKNMVYVSPKCKGILVIITSDYWGQYESHLNGNCLYQNIKGIPIHYFGSSINMHEIIVHVNNILNA